MVPKILKIGQISDIHISENEGLIQGIDVRANFLKILKSESMKNLDLLVLSGDLANENAEPGAYKFIAQIIKEFSVPCCIIPGNHDKFSIMQKFFNFNSVSSKSCYYRYDLYGKTIFFLDSACGFISNEQLDWLQAESSKVNSEIIVFMHHPPCFCGHKFMDLHYYLQNMCEVQQVLANIKNLTHIYAGHYHYQFTTHMGRQMVHVAPAGQFQIDPKMPYFNIKNTNPGWQIIKFGENFIETKVYFK